MLRDRVEEFEEERARLKEHEADLATQSHLPRVEQELRYWEERLRKAILVDPAKQPHDKVAFGARVTVKDEDGKRHDYTIVGEDESERSEEHTSELQSLMRISYAVFCLKKKKLQTNTNNIQ